MEEEILELAQKAGLQAEVYSASFVDTPVRFEANRLKEVTTRNIHTIALRVIKEGKIGYAVASGQIEPRKLLEMALETVPFGSPASFQFPGPEAYPPVDCYDPEVERVKEEEMVTIGQALIDGVRREWPQLQCEAGVRKGVGEVCLLNSRGGQARFKKTFFSLGVEGLLVRNGDMLFVGDSLSSGSVLRDTKPLVEETLFQLEAARKTVPSPSGKVDAIFTHRGVAHALALPLMVAFNGKVVYQGASPLGDKLGQRLFPSSLSLRDDATIPFSPPCRPCDDEGIPSQQTPLIQDGVVAGFLYDLQTAALAGRRSTGNGSRQEGSTVPTPTPSALVFSPGKASLKEMIGQVKQGILVDQLIGAGQGNILGGEFSGNVLLGYKIEGGEIVGRVKDTLIYGNVYEIFPRLVAIGREARWVMGMMWTPPLYFSGLSVSQKG